MVARVLFLWWLMTCRFESNFLARLLFFTCYSMFLVVEVVQLGSARLYVYVVTAAKAHKE